MDVFNAIKGRRSIRSFKRKDVPDNDLRKILEAGIWAPSAGNLQSWEFIIVKRDDVKRELARAAYGQHFIAEAPVVIVVCANIERSAAYYGERGRTLYTLQDTAAAIQNILLAAYALGYGTCWIGAFSEEAVKEILEIPYNIRPVAIIPLGIPATKPRPPPRMPLEKVVHHEKY